MKYPGQGTITVAFAADFLSDFRVGGDYRMMTVSDEELLRHYAKEGANPSLAALVQRHLDLVYSVARRHVSSSQVAEDVAQAVFIELARNARKISPGTPLVAWLHVVSRRTAINAARGEARRHAREQAAVEIAAMKSPPPAWETVAPLLDEAVESLPAADRAAILLRYFENRKLRDVGEALGLTDDAAQKRVTRALEQLRTFLGRRGIATTTAALAADLATSALHAAPPGLGASISSAAATTMSTAAVGGAHTLAMTTLQKSLVAGVLAVTAGFGVFEASVLQRQQGERDQLARRSAQLAATIEQTRSANTALAAQLAGIEKQIDARLALARAAAAPADNDAALERQIETWLKEATRLREFFAARPALATPEMSLLEEKHWAEIVSKAGSTSKLESESDLLRAAAGARGLAANLVSGRIQRALVAYVDASKGVLPDDLSQVLPYFDPPLTLDTLTRYKLAYSGKASDVPERERNNSLVTQRWVVEPTQDANIAIGLMGWSTHSAGPRHP